MRPCEDFRERLSALLSGRVAAPEWASLEWHEHLHMCSECRDLLEAEEALEVLLETLPEPRLPRALRQRVLARLATARPGLRAEAGLDQLLGLTEVAAPRDLADNVLQGLRQPRRAAREGRALDDLLVRVPAPVAPAGLADRVLGGLEAHRKPRRGQPVLERASGSWRSTPARWALAAGALLSVALGLWRATSRSGVEEGAATELAQGLGEATQLELLSEDRSDEPSDELLASLDLLESWEFLVGEDVEQVLASLDTLDELVLYLDDEGLGG